MDKDVKRVKQKVTSRERAKAFCEATSRQAALARQSRPQQAAKVVPNLREGQRQGTTMVLSIGG